MPEKRKEKKPTLQAMISKNKRLESKLKRVSAVNTTIRVASLFGLILGIYKRWWGMAMISTIGLATSLLMPDTIDMCYAHVTTLAITLLKTFYYMAQPFVEGLKKRTFRL